MKKLICLALCLLLCLLACAALADTEYEEGHLRFAVNEASGEVTILRLIENYAMVKVPDTLHGYPVTAIGSHAFYNSQRLEKVYLPATVTTIGDYAFASCPVLDVVEMPGVTAIGTSAFENCGLHKIALPKGLTTAGKRAFAECQSLYSVQVPASLTVIPEEMFTGCRFLKNVVLNEGLTAIGDKAFCSCAAMEEIALPMTLTELGVNPFVGCTGLKNFKVSSLHTALKVDKGGLITVADATLVSYAAGQRACGYTVPADVKVVGAAAFSQALNLQEVTVPSTTEKVNDYAFWYCTALKTATVAEGVYVHPTAFAECYSLVNANLPASLDLPALPVDAML